MVLLALVSLASLLALASMVSLASLVAYFPLLSFMSEDLCVIHDVTHRIAREVSGLLFAQSLVPERGEIALCDLLIRGYALLVEIVQERPGSRL